MPPLAVRPFARVTTSPLTLAAAALLAGARPRRAPAWAPGWGRTSPTLAAAYAYARRTGECCRPPGGFTRDDQAVLALGGLAHEPGDGRRVALTGELGVEAYDQIRRGPCPGSRRRGWRLASRQRERGAAVDEHATLAAPPQWLYCGRDRTRGVRRRALRLERASWLSGGGTSSGRSWRWWRAS